MKSCNSSSHIGDWLGSEFDANKEDVSADGWSDSELGADDIADLKKRVMRYNYGCEVVLDTENPYDFDGFTYSQFPETPPSYSETDSYSKSMDNVLCSVAVVGMDQQLSHQNGSVLPGSSNTALSLVSECTPMLTLHPLEVTELKCLATGTKRPYYGELPKRDAGGFCKCGFYWTNYYLWGHAFIRFMER